MLELPQNLPSNSRLQAEGSGPARRPVSVVEAQLREFLASLPPGVAEPPPKDFAARLQWDAWQNHRRELEAELIEAKESDPYPVTNIRLFEDAAKFAGDDAVDAQSTVYLKYRRPIELTVQRFLKDCPGLRESVEDLAHTFYLKNFSPPALEKALCICAEKEIRLRSYLQVELKSFLRNRLRHSKVRQGINVELDPAGAEVPTLQPGWESESARLFDHEWACALLSQAREDVMTKLSGTDGIYQALLPWMEGENPSSLREIGAKLGKTEDAMKGRLKRLREEFRESILRRIRAGMPNATEAEIEAERIELVRLSRP
jgi:hypothetical protein